MFSKIEKSFYNINHLKKFKPEKTYFFSSLQWAFLVLIITPNLLFQLALKQIRLKKYTSFESYYQYLDVMRSDIFLYLGFSAFALFILHLVRGWRWRMILFMFLQFSVLLFSILEIVAHQYNITTGSHLTYSLLLYSVIHLNQIGSVMASESNLFSNVAFLFTLLVTIILPWLMITAINSYRRHQKFQYVEGGHKFLHFILSVFFYALLIFPSNSSKDIFLSQNSVYSIFQTFIEEAFSKKMLATEKWQAPVNTSLVKRNLSRKPKNLVIIILESTRADATSVYNRQLVTTPFLKELAAKSLVADNAFTVIPHTSKALVAIHCGIEPNTSMPITEAEENGIASKCLPTLLSEVGYRTVFFQSPTETFENRRGMVANLGHKEFFPGESLPKGDAEKINYFGFEDKIMLKPASTWLAKHKKNHSDKPFMMTFLTGASHHNYGLPSWYHAHKWHKDAKFNRYLNTVHLADRFVRRLFARFKKLKLYDNTLFLLVGDHGEGFMEHDDWGHSYVIYNEGIKVPLIIHTKGMFNQGYHVKAFVQQPDILPTLVDLLGFDIKNNYYRGKHILQPRTEDVFYGSCWHTNQCLTRFTSQYKYIHYFNKRPDEVYHLASDMLEKKDIALSFTAIKKWRKLTLAWYKNTAAFYSSFHDSFTSKQKE